MLVGGDEIQSAMGRLGGACDSRGGAKDCAQGGCGGVRLSHRAVVPLTAVAYLAPLRLTAYIRASGAESWLVSRCAALAAYLRGDICERHSRVSTNQASNRLQL